MDIELNGQDMTGLDVAKQINSFDKADYLVFVTGYAQYALDSIAVHPYAYLLKPINVNEFTDLIIDVSKLVDEKRSKNLDHLIIKTRGSIIHIPKEKIIFLEKSNGYTLIHTREKKYQLSRNLDELERLIGDDFIRIHRSFIINIKHVSNMQQIADRSYEVEFFEYPEKAQMSRYHYKKYNSLFVNS